jgi:hypothetical protein
LGCQTFTIHTKPSVRRRPANHLVCLLTAPVSRLAAVIDLETAVVDTRPGH